MEVVGELRKRARLYGLTGLDRSGELVASAEEHLELLDLLIGGDAPGAEACMRRHLGHVRSLWSAGRGASALPAGSESLSLPARLPESLPDGG